MTAIGDRFGSYVIERELGRGGMGVVYAARHQILGHQVAIKVLHNELSKSEDVVQRFFNEARAAAAIAHPNIARVHDVGVTDNNDAYLVMDLLSGESLAQRIRASGPLPVAVAIAITRQIAEALGAAHAAGIVHRDLKPDNVFLVPDGPVPRALLLDFGVAKLTGSLSSGDLRTKTGALLGTPHYMSPEQCDGERTIDHRSDFYSLGCVLFQMITGRMPFEGGIGAVIGMHLHVPPPLLRDLLPTAPGEVEAIVGRLMAKDPRTRYQDAPQLIAALDAWLPLPADHTVPPMRRFDMTTAETLPAHVSTDDNTVASVVPHSEKQRNVVPPRPSSRDPEPKADDAPTLKDRRRGRGILYAGIGIVVVTTGALAIALQSPSSRDASREGIAPTSVDARIGADAAVAMADAAVAMADAVGDIDAAADLDAHIGAGPVDAAGRGRDAAIRDARDGTIRDAAGRDAAVRDAAVRDAGIVDAATTDAIVAAAPVDAGGKQLSIEKRLAFLANAEDDFEASREYMLLELEAPGDPRLARAKEDAHKVINASHRGAEKIAIHNALVDHAWKKGLETCRPFGGDVAPVDIVVQCTVFACILDEEELGKAWFSAVGYRPMQEKIIAFCERFHK